MIGIWEAVDLPQAFRVFRLELSPNDPSTLTQGLPVGPSFADVVTSATVKDGNVLITLKTTHESMIGLQTIHDGSAYTSTGTSVLKGFARVCAEGDGVLDATLTLEPRAPAPRVWKLTFYKTAKGTVVDSIKAMEQKAEDLAVALKRQRAASGKASTRP